MSYGKVSPGQPLSIPAEAYNAMVDAAVAHRKGDGKHTGSERGKRFTIDARITGHARDGSNWRWRYDWEQVVPDGGDFEYTAAGYTSSGYGQALNRFEAMNGASGLLGNGVDTASLDATSIEPQPSPSGLIVELTWSVGPNGSGRWLFSYATGLNGACE